MITHKYTNRLIHQTSPYLLQHAHNPVDWFAWSDEALQKAMDEDKPILLSIGYSACHWCHVMEHESFEDEETAAIMNKHFINIKVDREERPDIDHIYMDALQTMTGSGGWPLNVFLLPDKRPFYGGTYFPPQRMYNRNSWKDVLIGISNAYRERKNELTEQAENLTEHLLAANIIGIKNNEEEEGFFKEETLQAIAENILRNADMDWGGFGAAPKFPQTMGITYLLRHYHFTKHKPSLDAALLALDKMYMGGLYDYLGGGFARYSTDAKWQVPHFEKMLYDNALLLGVYAEAYQLTHKQEYADVLRKTISFLQREMLALDGGFYAAIDADSEGVEGKFYVWDKKEIDELLGEEKSKIFCKMFDVKEDGNWEHTNVLWMPEKMEDIAALLNISLNDLKENIATSSEILLQKRNERIRPGLDDKILLGWNGLMITVLCKCYAAVGDDAYLHLAEKNILFIEKKMMNDDGSYVHSFKERKNNQPAFLDDYASLAEAYIHLQEITGKSEYLLKAKSIAEYVLRNFSDEVSPLFYFTEEAQKDIIVRKKEIYDGATPSGNAQMVFVLQYLSIIFDKTIWKNQATEMLLSLSNIILKHPSSFALWALNLYRMVKEIPEIAIVGKEYLSGVKGVMNKYIPFKIIQSAKDEDLQFPLLSGKKALHEETLFYLCKNYSCRKAVNNVLELISLVNQ